VGAEGRLRPSGVSCCRAAWRGGLPSPDFDGPCGLGMSGQVPLMLRPTCLSRDPDARDWSVHEDARRSVFSHCVACFANVSQGRAIPKRAFFSSFVWATAN
jgi:hypothetical protein